MLPSQSSEKIMQILVEILSDNIILYFKTHGFHWNVVGPQFYSLHELFEEQYEALWKRSDEIAERIRALDFKAPQTLQEILSKTSLKECSSLLSALEMVQELAVDQKNFSLKVGKFIDVCEELGDKVTADMLIKYKSESEEMLWMLNSILK